jgi:hypothetical protein
MIRTTVAAAGAMLVLAACSSSGTGHVTEPAGLRRADTFAATGDATALTQVADKTIRAPGGCEQPNWYATVGPTITGRQLAADELAFFKQHTDLNRGSCGAFLYVTHPGDQLGVGYTAGAVIDQDGVLELRLGALGPDAYTFRY